MDTVPKAAAGTFKGLIGIFAYIGAGTQDWVSGLLIDARRITAAGRATYDFRPAFTFWIGTSILSLLLAATAGKVRPRE